MAVIGRNSNFQVSSRLLFIDGRHEITLSGVQDSTKNNSQLLVVSSRHRAKRKGNMSAAPEVLGSDRSKVVGEDDLAFFRSHHLLLTNKKDGKLSDRNRGALKRPMPRPACMISGLFNEGATCYLNSVLQCLLQCTEFSHRILHEENDGTDNNSPPIAKNLQRLFAQMLFSNQHAVRTEALLRSFGWSKDEVYQQHDAHELFSLLFSALEESSSEKTKQALQSFQGDEESKCPRIPPP